MNYNLPPETEIIAYRPVLEKDRVITQKTADYYDERVLFEHSPSVLQVAENLPSSTIDTLDRLTENTDSMISVLDALLSNVSGDNLSFADFKQALMDGNSEIVEKYVNAHKDNIEGDTRVEVYENLYRLKDEVSNLRSIFSSLVYGNKAITSEQASSIDKMKTDKLIQYEREGKIQKINYAAISIDAQINKVIAGQADTLTSYGNQLFALTMSAKPKNVTDFNGVSVQSTLENFFDEYARRNNEDRKKLDSVYSRKIIDTGIARAYVKRKDLLDLLNAKQALSQVSGYSSTIDNSINDAVQRSYDYVLDLNKGILMGALYRDDYLTTLKQKSELRNIYTLLK